MPAILEAVSLHRSNKMFGGDIVFVVHAPDEPTPALPRALEDVRSRLERQIAKTRLVTAARRAWTVRVEQRKWLPVES